jgi:alkylation response protein AidB-like acyl-CoA dehydrogenase
MSSILTADQIAIRDGAQRFAERAFGPARFRALRDMPNGRDDFALTQAAEGGWLTMLVPEEHGGGGQGLTEACLVAEAFGRALAPIPFAGAAAALAAISRMTGALAPGDLAAAMASRALVLPALADAHGDTLRCRVSGNGVRLEGRRDGVQGAGAAGLFVVSARMADHDALILVPRACDGLQVADRRTVDGMSMGTLAFEACDLPAASALIDDAAAWDIVADMRIRLAILVAAELLGIMDAALQRTVAYLKIREQFGRTLGSFQALQFKAVDAYVTMASTRSLTYEAARMADAGGESAELTALAAKSKAAEAALAVTRTMIQLHGAIGFTDEHDIGLYLKRALALSASYGTAAQHRRAIAARTLNGAKPIRITFRQDTPQDAAFRREVAQWLAANLPARLRNLPVRPPVRDASWWHRKLYERGWIAPNWPKQYGGMEASVTQQIILYEELGAIGAPEISAQAIYHLGPILQAFGTPEQKARHLPGMLSGGVVWCQGYSEPSSGSDLASLRTRAVRDGEHFVVNGQKIWTTWGQHADWMYALVRTNPDVKKQAGISFMLIDMTTPGITRRPIRTIAGDEEFSEIFFDNVRVPAENIVGAVDDGWRVANALLEKERLNGANPQKCVRLLATVKNAAAASGLIEDQGFRDRLVRTEIDVVALNATYAQIVDIVETGTRTNADFAFAKLVAAELLQELCELLVEVLGADAATAGEIEVGGERVFPAQIYLQNRRATIYGGTSEIQRTLIAKRVLGLS